MLEFGYCCQDKQITIDICFFYNFVVSAVIFPLLYSVIPLRRYGKMTILAEPGWPYISRRCRKWK